MNRQMQCRIYGLVSAVALAALLGSRVCAAETPKTANRFCDSIGINTHLFGGGTPYTTGTSYSFYNNVQVPLAWLGVRHIRDYMAVDDGGLPGDASNNPGHEAIFNPGYTAASDTLDDYYNRLKQLGNQGVKCDLSMYAAGWEFQVGAVDMARESQIITNTFLLGCQEAAEGANEWDRQGPGYIQSEAPYVPAWQPPSHPPTWQSVLNIETSNIWSQYRGSPSTAGIQIYSGTITDVDGDPNAGTYPDTDGYFNQYGNVSGKVDYGNCHPYCASLGSLNYPEYGLPHLIPGWQKFWGPAAPAAPGPFVITETGYFTGTAQWSVSPTVQEKYTLRTLFSAFNLGAYRTYLFELYDLGTDATNQEQNFGLIDYNLTPKPSYNALESLIGLLSDSSTSTAVTPLAWSLDGSTANVKHTLLQKADGSYYLALWLGVPSGDSTISQAVTATVPSTIASGTLYAINQYGSMSSNPVTITNGQMSFNVTDNVSVLKLTVTPASAPVLSSISPTTRTAGGAQFTLTANGSTFISGSIVKWNGVSQITKFVSSMKLTATIPASLIKTAGKASITVTTPHVATSESKTLTINP